MKNKRTILNIFVFGFLTLSFLISGLNSYVYAYDNVKIAPPIPISKIQDSNIKAYLANSRAQAELYFDTNYSYKNLCKTSQNKYGIKETLNTLSKDLKTKVDCDSNKDQYAVEAKLKNEKGYFCVDYTGRAIIQKNSKGSNSMSCEREEKKSKKNNKIKINPTNAEKIIIKDLIGLDEQYGPGEIIKFSLVVNKLNKKPFYFKDDSHMVIATLWEEPRVSSDLIYEGIYNKKKKHFDFNFKAPTKSGSYSLALEATCVGPWNIINGDCEKEAESTRAYLFVPVEIK